MKMYDNLILGNGAMFSMDSKKTQLNNNVCVIGDNSIIGLSQMTFRKKRVAKT